MWLTAAELGRTHLGREQPPEFPAPTPPGTVSPLAQAVCSQVSRGVTVSGRKLAFLPAGSVPPSGGSLLNSQIA